MSESEGANKVMTQEPALEPVNQEMDREGGLTDVESDVERERKEKLLRKAMQLSDEINELYEIAHMKEKELTHIKSELGVTFLDEFKTSMGASFKSVSDKWHDLKGTETYKKTEDTLSTWKDKVTQSEGYKKTVTTLSTTGEKATQGLQTATSRTGEAFKRAGESFIENETVQAAWARVVTLKDSLAQQLSPTGETPGDKEPEVRPDNETLVPDEETKESKEGKEKENK